MDCNFIAIFVGINRLLSLQNLDAKHTMPRFSVLKAVKEKMDEFFRLNISDRFLSKESE